MKKIICVLILFVTIFSCFACTKNVLKIENPNYYNIMIEYDDETKTLNCNQTVKIFNDSEDNLSVLKFHLYPKAFTEGAVNPAVSALYVNKAYPNGKSYGDIEVSEVKIKNSVVDFYTEEADNNILVVSLPSSALPKTYTEIFMQFNVKLPNINHRFGYGANTINIANFYPIACVYENGNFVTEPYSVNGDPFYSVMSNYDVKIKYLSNYVLASSGVQTKNEDITLYRTTYIIANSVRDFACVLSNKFQKLSQTVEDTTVNYFYYNDENPEVSLTTCIDSLKTFNKLFGKYPYKELSVCKTNFVYGGMEYPNLVYISDDIANFSDYTNTIVHEIAHQWWYGLVGNNQFQYGWLDEGLTEYSTVLFYEENTQYNVKREDVIKTTLSSYELFLQVYNEIFKEVDTTMTRKLNEFKTEPEYVYIAYVKGMLLFNDVREFIGKENFLNGLKYYFNCYSGKNVVPENLIRCLEIKSHFELNSFFNSYLNGNVKFLF